MYKNIKAACAVVFGDLKVTPKHFDLVHARIMSVCTRPGGNAEFFSGALFGTEFISFTAGDVNYVISEVFGADPTTIKPALAKVQNLSLVDNAIRDELNVTCAYICHLVYASKWSTKETRRCVRTMHLLFNVKTMCWLYAKRLHHTCSEQVARTAYELTTGRYLIKSLGSWWRVMEARADCLVSDDGLHITTLKDFTDDRKIGYYITNSIGTIGSRIKYSYGLMDQASRSDAVLRSNSMTTTGFDGEPELATRQLSSERGRRAIDAVIADRRSFVREEWLQVTIRINRATSHKAIKGIAVWVADNRYGEFSKDIQSMICNSSIVLAQSMMRPEYLALRDKSLRPTLQLLRGFYGASRSASKNLKDLRAAGERVVKGSGVNIAPTSSASTRCSLFIYMCVAAIKGSE